MAKAKRKQKAPEKASESIQIDWQRAGRWALAFLLFSVMGAGAALGVVKLQDPNVVPLKVVRIDGQFRHLKRVELEKAVGHVVRGNFFTVDVERIRSAAEALPWVDTASVRRVWPETLVMSVTEQQPLALWTDGRLVNVRGEIFAPEDTELPQGLPAFSGPDEDALRVVEWYADMQRQLESTALGIVQIQLDRRGSWTLELSNKMTVKLGRSAPLERLDRFVRVFPALQQDIRRRVRAIDLRYTNGIAVDWEVNKTEEVSVEHQTGVSGDAEAIVRMGKGQV